MGDPLPGARRSPVGLEQRLLRRARHAGFGRAEVLVVAFSGGRDSLALAAALRTAQDVIGLRLLLVHVDHLLRAESGAEAVRASELAKSLQLNIRCVAPPRAPREVHPHVGIEEAARRERYRLLCEVAVEVGARAVATGHHEQDQAETVLLHMLRGSGVRGAAGMAERVAWPFGGCPADGDISQEHTSPELWRPILQESPAVIADYVARLDLMWIEDPSNSELAMRRNVVRHRIIPRLEAEFPGASAALARYANLAAADDEALEQIVQSAMRGQVDPGGRLRIAVFREQPLAVQRRMIRRWLIDFTGWRELSAERGDAVLGLVRSGAGRRVVEIGGGWTVSLRDGMLYAWRDGREDREHQ